MGSPFSSEAQGSCFRQGSLYSLTLNEVQTQLSYTGKPIKTMNLDEFLQNVIYVEEGQMGQNSSFSSPASLFLGNFTSDRMLNKRTVEDVWKDILTNDQSICKKSVLGETRLDDFLVRAGIISVGNQNSDVDQPLRPMEDDSMFRVSKEEEWFRFQLPTSLPNPSISPAFSESQSVFGRKRGFSGEMTETMVDRRKKRMIKNRESAARSRARKQAYTSQLEHEVFELREINCWLKKQEEVETLLSLHNPPLPVKFQLRRTSSTIF